MALPVKLQDVVDQMDMVSDEISAYINRKTGDLVIITDEDVFCAEDDDSSIIPDWQQDTIAETRQVLADDDYIELPGSFEIHEYEIMERFCHMVEDERLRNTLLNGINGRGAFRFFKSCIYEEGVEKEWFAFKVNAFKAIAAEFLKRERIPFTDNK